MTKLEILKDKTVESIISQYETEPSHCRQVTKLALQIFDITKDLLHNYGEYERNLLRYGGLLHDIGYSISFDKHNKHAYEIIINTQMAGFEENEIVIIANLARYHNGKPPKAKHKNFACIKDKKTKKLIQDLSAFLRIADGLDRSHTDAVEDIKCLIDRFTGTCAFILTVRGGNCSAELYGANKKKDLFEQQFDLEVKFVVQSY